jgi:hypothetical protein
MFRIVPVIIKTHFKKNSYDLVQSGLASGRGGTLLRIASRSNLIRISLLSASTL